MKKDKTSDSSPENRDPISGAKGSHPVGVGMGAAAGGAAGIGSAVAIGAAAGTAVGPVGTAAGAVAGAVVGAFAGKGIAEKVNPTREEAYWRENHGTQPYAGDRGYDEYRDAYRVGYEGYGKYGQGGRFDDYQDEFRSEFERGRGKSMLTWDEAQHASRAAWERLEGSNDTVQRLIGYEIRDENEEEIGEVHNLWLDDTGQPIFLGVKTGWFFGKNHVVPVYGAQVNNNQEIIRIPYTKEKIQGAPTNDADQEISDAHVQEILEYYGVTGLFPTGSTTGEPVSQSGKSTKSEKRSKTTDEATVKLHEEELKVGKREVSAGGVRLRKVVRIETVNQPVELRSEEIVIERVPGDRSATDADASFEGEDIFIPLRREEAVVQKESHVREEVRVGKKANVDTQRITEKVRSEDVEIERTDEKREQR